MWPPFREVTAMSSSRISCASWGSWVEASAFTSAGLRMVSRMRGEGAGAEGLLGRGEDDSAVAPDLKLGEGDARLGLLRLLDFQLGLLQAGFAELEELVALLKFGQQLSQRNFARFHRFHDGLEFGQGVLEGEFGVFGIHARKDVGDAGYFKQSLGSRRRRFCMDWTHESRALDRGGSDGVATGRRAGPLGPEPGGSAPARGQPTTGGGGRDGPGHLCQVRRLHAGEVGFRRGERNFRYARPGDGDFWRRAAVDVCPDRRLGRAPCRLEPCLVHSGGGRAADGAVAALRLVAPVPARAKIRLQPEHARAVGVRQAQGRRTRPRHWLSAALDAAFAREMGGYGVVDLGLRDYVWGAAADRSEAGRGGK